MSEPTEHDRDQADATQLRLLAINLAAELRRARRDAYGADHAETADVLDEARAILAAPRAGQAFLERVLALELELAQALSVLTTADGLLQTIERAYQLRRPESYSTAQQRWAADMALFHAMRAYMTARKATS